MFRRHRRKRGVTLVPSRNGYHAIPTSDEYEADPQEAKTHHSAIRADAKPAPLHLAFDIDGTLAIGFGPKALDKLPYLDWFKENGLLLHVVMKPYWFEFGEDTTVIPHLILPGTKELMQFVFQIPSVKVSFTSAGSDKRNRDFKKEFLSHTLGRERYNAVERSINVLSREDLTLLDRQQQRHRLKKFGLGCNQLGFKNLKDIKGLCLDQALIVENDPRNIYPGQERNLVYVPLNEPDQPFSKLHGKTDFQESDSSYLLAVNQIFYLAGILKTGLDAGRDQLVDTLFKLHFTLQANGTYKPVFKELVKSREYYLKGLTELQKINPTLKFYGGEQAEEFFRGDKVLETLKLLPFEEPSKTSAVDVTLGYLVGSLCPLFAPTPAPAKSAATEPVKILQAPAPTPKKMGVVTQ